MGFLALASKRCMLLCHCCPADCTCTSLAHDWLFPWNYTIKDLGVKQSYGYGGPPSWPSKQAGIILCKQMDRGTGSLESTCAARVGVKVRISQTRMSKLLCPTYPTVSWINQRESLDFGYIQWEKREMFSFVSVQVVLLKQAKISFLTWVTAWIGWQGVNPFSMCVKKSITVCQSTASHLFFS